MRKALEVLGVRRLVFAIHDVSFPSDPDEDVGRGAPGSKASLRLIDFVRELGFDAIQLGPQGQTSRDNPSPYDGTLFSRNVDSIPLAIFRAPELSGLVSEGALRAAVAGPGHDEEDHQDEPPARIERDAPAATAKSATATTEVRAEHQRAHDTLHRLVGDAFRAFSAQRGGIGAAKVEAVASALARFWTLNRTWLERDALYDAISRSHEGAGFRDWGHDLDLWAADDEERAAKRRSELGHQYREAIERYAFGQFLAHTAHAEFRRHATANGIALYADFQVGLSDSDAWTLRGLLLRTYVMGAPPSRTTPAGQPWNYPILNPALYYASGRDEPGSAPGPVLEFLEARADKTLREYDSVRIDHPHGFICPWVYRSDAGDPGQAVRDGARLFESPDLSDHPELMQYARVRADQIDRTKARYADEWVGPLEPDQVSRYAAAMSVVVEAAKRHGRDPSGIACEVLSTMPRPLGSVLERLDLGRFRVAQKANLDDPTDVYRAENAGPRDWIMLGNHDTPTVWALVRAMGPEQRSKWAHYLHARLAPRHDSSNTAETHASSPKPAQGREGSTRRLEVDENSIRESPEMLAHAMLAELFVSRAENVSIFFADLFGFEARYNVPGDVGPQNWSLRLPANFEALYWRRNAKLDALNLPVALALALEATSHEESGVDRLALAASLRRL